MRTTSSPQKFLRPVQLTAIIFFTVSGGPYGLEPILNYVGGNLALFLIVLTPLLWSLPTILMVLELNGMMPKNGGYYQWVKQALGLKWGFFEGWWSWMFIFVDLAIYPVLFVQYLSFLFPAITAYKYLVCLFIIWSSALLNLFGIVPVGKSSVALGVGVLLPFIILFAYAFVRLNAFLPPVAGSDTTTIGFTAFGMGLFTVMWNFLGWDNASSFVEEVDQPVRSYFVSTAAAFVLIVGIYIVAVVTGTKTGMDAGVLQAQGFPSLGMHVGGWWFGVLLAVGGMASALGLFLSILLSVSRVPKAMADDGILPVGVSKVHQRYNTPYVSIIICAVVVSGMVLWEFADLLIIDVILYSMALFLEFLSLIMLRIRQPDVARPFKVPFKVAGLITMTVLPMSCVVCALVALLSTNNLHSNATWFAIAAVITAPLAWWVIERLMKKSVLGFREGNGHSGLMLDAITEPELQ
jgi:amino acid transporter